MPVLVAIRFRAVFCDANESTPQEDRHKAPPIRIVHPLSLQTGSKVASAFPLSFLAGDSLDSSMKFGGPVGGVPRRRWL